MNQKFKVYHILLAILIIAFCGVIILNYGWVAYGTLTERPGLRGDLYYYYQLPRFVFFFYEALVAGIALLLIILQLESLIKRNHRSLTKTFKAFLLFICVVIVCEIVLQVRFVGKG